jgi:hypothetical protein
MKEKVAAFASKYQQYLAPTNSRHCGIETYNGQMIVLFDFKDSVPFNNSFDVEKWLNDMEIPKTWLESFYTRCIAIYKMAMS